MLYSEFLKGTRAPETPDTYDQFQIIGQIYEDCEGMTKEEAYRIWKQTYGRELKRRELRQRERLELLINREDYDSADRPHRAAIYHELSTLFWAAYYNKDGSRCRLATEGRCFTDPFVLVPIPAGTEHTQTNTPHYDVTLCVTAADDIGKVNLEVYDKASNGFKVRNLGSAKSVSFTWTIINTNIQ